MEEGSDSPVSSLRRWRWGEQPQGYLAPRLWKWSGLPLHRKSHRCRPLDLLSIFSLWALKRGRGRTSRREKGEEAHLGREREKYGGRTNTKNNSSNMFQIRKV